MRVLGFMTGTSLDAVDMAVLETDGEAIQAFGPAGERKLTDATRDLLLDATHQALKWARGEPEPAIFAQAREVVAREHFAAAQSFIAEHGLTWDDLDLLGMHGQTVLHERPKPGQVGRTVQLGDAALLAKLTGRPVAHDFRTADVASGGEGAPLAPVYHLARAQASGLQAPLAVLNVGGVANVTFWNGGNEIAAFDTGPGNGMIDLLVQARGAGRYDAGGRYASVGRADEGGGRGESRIAVIDLQGRQHGDRRGARRQMDGQLELDALGPAQATGQHELVALRHRTEPRPDQGQRQSVAPQGNDHSHRRPPRVLTHDRQPTSRPVPKPPSP